MKQYKTTNSKLAYKEYAELAEKLSGMSIYDISKSKYILDEVSALSEKDDPDEPKTYIHSGCLSVLGNLKNKLNTTVNREDAELKDYEEAQLKEEVEKLVGYVEVWGGVVATITYDVIIRQQNDITLIERGYALIDSSDGLYIYSKKIKQSDSLDYVHLVVYISIAVIFALSVIF